LLSFVVGVVLVLACAGRFEEIFTCKNALLESLEQLPEKVTLKKAWVLLEKRNVDVLE
jgi:hypothetical protein